jgi:hypothetical protein
MVHRLNPSHAADSKSPHEKVRTSKHSGTTIRSTNSRLPTRSSLGNAAIRGYCNLLPRRRTSSGNSFRHPSDGSGDSIEKISEDHFKEETHAARWGLLRGYSGKATKWVDFVMTDSTRRESCHLLKVTAKPIRVKGLLRIVPKPLNTGKTPSECT